MRQYPNSFYLRKKTVPLLLMLLLAGCSGEKPEQSFAKARQQLESGNKTAAVIELKNALQNKPDYAEARLLLGKIQNEQGDPASAEKELRKALELGTARETVLPLLGQALLAQQNFNKVLEEIPDKLEGKPRDTATLLAIRGDAQVGLKQLDDAMASYEAARKADPNAATPLQGLAILAMLKQQPDEAMRLTEEAIQKDEKGAAPWVLKAGLLRVQNKQEDAAKAYEEAVKREPGHVGARVSLALLYMGAQKFDAAQREIDAARNSEPKALSVSLAQAQLHFAQKKYAEARDILQDILKAAPNHPQAILMMGATQLALDAPVQAESYLSNYVKSVPGNPYARRLLAYAYIKNKQPEKAIDVLSPLLASNTQDSAVLALAGDAYLQLKDYAKSTEYLEKAAQAQPKNASLRTELALSKLGAGDISQGTADLETAADMEGSPLQTDLALISAYFSKREYDKAFKAIDGLEKKQPNSPLPHVLRGGAHLAKQDTINARKSFEKALAINPAFYPAAANLATLDMRDKNPATARKRFESVLSADKNSIPAMVALATLERSAGNEKGFLDWLEKAVHADPKALKPRILQVEYYVFKKDTARALSIARDAQTANPTNAEALDLLGRAQLAAGEKSNAITTFDKLVAANPANPFAYLRLATAQGINQNLTEARKSLNKALQLNPDLVDARLSLIGLDLQEKKASAAIQGAQQLQRQQPNFPGAYTIEGDIYARDRNFAKSLPLYQKAFSLEKSSSNASKLHKALLETGKQKDADAHTAQWLKAHPEDGAYRGYLGDTYLHQGKLREAATQYQAIVQQTPNNIVALNNLAWVLQKLKDPQALAYAERANKLLPDNPPIMDTLGWILLEQGKTDRAIDLLQKALSKTPDSAETRYHLALAFHRKGDNMRSENELKRVLNTGANFAQRQEAEALLAQIKSKR